MEKYKATSKENVKEEFKMSVKVLITGANYNNKGAQAMLFVCVDEIKKRVPDCDIYFGCGTGDPKLDNVSFKQICFSREGRYIALGGGQAVFNFFVAIAKGCIQFIKGKRHNLFRLWDVKKYIKTMDLIVDVSGFALGDKWSKRTNENFLNIIRLAKKNNVPIYIMPQSFGPFEFSEELSYLKEEIADLLRYPIQIFAREKEGYELLTKDFGLNNVVQSYDLVLQNKGVDLKNVFQSTPEISVPDIQTEHNVGIVPNKQCFRHGEEEDVLEKYKVIIQELLSRDKEVYLFRHSGEDLVYCKKIADMFADEPRVHFLQNNFSCLEYDAFVKKFEFIICSRFHGIVHAYKNYVPVIALGWAVKYRELTEAVGQSSYIFDITAKNCKKEQIVEAVKKMIDHADIERKTIQEHVNKIQTENCFECISEWVKNRNE